MRRNHFGLYFLALLLFFTYACGSSGSKGNSPSGSSGSVFYPEAESVKVCSDENGNGYPDDADCVDATDKGSGEWGYVFNKDVSTNTLAVGIKGKAIPQNPSISAAAAVDAYTNYLSAPKGYNIVSPFTTFVKNTMDVKGIDEQAAVTAVRTELKLSADSDPKQKPSGNDAKIFNIIAVKTAEALKEALITLPDFDVTKGLAGLVSVIKDSVAKVADQIKDAAEKGDTVIIIITLPSDLAAQVENANKEAESHLSFTLPYTLRRAQTAVANGKLYAFLGYKNKTSDATTNEDVLVYDIASRKWEESASIEGFPGYQDNITKSSIVSGAIEKNGESLLVFSYNYLPYVKSIRNFYKAVVTSGQKGKWVNDNVSLNFIDNVSLNFNGSSVIIGSERIIVDLRSNSNKVYTVNFLDATLESSSTSGSCSTTNYNTLFVNGKKMFVGSTSNGSSSRGNFCVYDIASKTWTEITDKQIFPQSLDIAHSAGIFATYNTEGKGYMLSGSKGGQLMDKYVEFDMGTLSWSDIKTATGDIPPIEVGGKFDDSADMQGSEAEHRVYNGKIYVVGGKSGFVNKAWEFDTATGVWKRI